MDMFVDVYVFFCDFGWRIEIDQCIFYCEYGQGDSVYKDGIGNGDGGKVVIMMMYGCFW